jgi:LemA protein
MSGMKLVGAVVVVVLLGGGLAAGCTYNRLTAQEEGVKSQWSQIDTVLQRRSDLIPNLVETVKGFAQQEKDVFQAVADARAKMAGAQTTEQKVEARNAEQSALARLLVVVENYPQLKSDQVFLNLMSEISGTENRINAERNRYNEITRNYNTARRRFPANLTASLFGFREYPYFNAPESAKTVPTVDFKKK